MRNSLAVLLVLMGPSAFAGPKVAVVLDDFGLTYKANPADEEWMALAGPLTFAVMPQSPRTKQAARSAMEAGRELIIHYPFDPFQVLDLAKDSATSEDVAKAARLLEKSLEEMPGAVGLSNHRSPRASRNRPLMREFMRLLKTKKLYYLDSKVLPGSVAYEEARAAGVPAAENAFFLDTAQIHSRAFCEKALAAAVARARRRGEIIVIGHHYFRGTLDCLKDAMPRYAKEGVEFVKVSALAR